MTLVSTIPPAEANPETQNTAIQSSKSLIVGTEAVVYPDPEISSVDVKASQNALQKLFEQTVSEKGEQTGNRFKWVGENEIQVDGLSGMTLHNFLLKAEALGKKVTYRRSIVFTITD